MKKLLSLLLPGILLIAACTISIDRSPPKPEKPVEPAKDMIIDHSCTNIYSIPESAILKAKERLRIGYGHTSHGSQLTTGMKGLVTFMNGKGYPTDLYRFNATGVNGGLYLHEGGKLVQDCGYHPQWVEATKNYLGAPTADGKGSANLEINVIMWSWCGQASSRTEETMLSTYLLPMSELEKLYPAVTFVYMTGHADGTGEKGNLHQRNQQIRKYCIDNKKVLYDFYDIECYDPEGNYYGDKMLNDNCDYDSDGDGIRDTNWAKVWQANHTENVDWYSCSSAHSQALNANRKAFAAWWLFARLGGWDGKTFAK